MVVVFNILELGYDGVIIIVCGVNIFGKVDLLVVVDGVFGCFLECIDLSIIEMMFVLKDVLVVIYGV